MTPDFVTTESFLLISRKISFPFVVFKASEWTHNTSHPLQSAGKAHLHFGEERGGDQSEYMQHLNHRCCINNVEKTAAVGKNCPFLSSASLYSYCSSRSSLWSVIRFSLLCSNVSCTFNNNNKKNKIKKNSSDFQSPHKGSLFYLHVLLSASEMSHTSENWHCDFLFVREAG